MIFAAEATSSASGLVDESGEAGVEVPESAIVEVEEIHPLPEVSMNTQFSLLILSHFTRNHVKEL